MDINIILLIVMILLKNGMLKILYGKEYHIDK